MKQKKIAAIVPAFNEKDNISKVIHDVKKHQPKIDVLVINDCSRDNTVEVARATKKAIVIDLPNNLGIGGAVQTGFKYAAYNDYDIVFQFDGDGQHRADQIEKLLQPILDGKADMVIGSRYVEKNEGFQSTFMRRVGIGLFKHVNSLLIRQKITDNTSGFRAYGREALRFLARNYPIDYPEPEAVILMGKNGFTICEVSVIMDEREGGISSISGLKSAYYMIKVMLACVMTAMRPAVR